MQLYPDKRIDEMCHAQNKNTRGIQSDQRGGGQISLLNADKNDSVTPPTKTTSITTRLAP